MHYNAELRDWIVYETQGFVVAAGRIYNDGKGRWPDGRLIQTSVLITPSAAKAGNVVATMNSRYLLVGAERSLKKQLAEREREGVRDAAATGGRSSI